MFSEVTTYSGSWFSGTPFEMKLFWIIGVYTL